MVGVTSTASPPLDLDPLANYRIHDKLITLEQEYS